MKEKEAISYEKIEKNYLYCIINQYGIAIFFVDADIRFICR